ncbi:MAG: hypothetical protein O2862_01425 [Bacteroidetes bacterium]|nr:hypothetical protein [Bacteroidota bacterium]MDA0898320.1 hypothetical protein [Bacteroidota bacterium]
MKITEALRILELDTLPKDGQEVSVAYKRLAKQRHPDSGGTEAAFQELGAAVEYVLRALALVDATVEKTQRRSAETVALAEKRAKMRAEMLKRRAEEDRKRNIQATWGISVILVIIVLFGVGMVIQPRFIHWMVEKERVERMATVLSTGPDRSFTIGWKYQGKSYTELLNGRFIDGKWLVGPAGMPMIKGGKYIVSFNARNPNYFELKDKYIDPETADRYFSLVKYPLAAALDLMDSDPDVVCIYWSVLDEFGVDGVAHLFFGALPMRKNWKHNERSFQALKESETFQKLYRSCLGIE